MQNAKEMKDDRVEQQADGLESKYGDFADTYAEARAEAAALAGLAEAADHWRNVRNEVRQGDDSDEQAPGSKPA